MGFAAKVILDSMAPCGRRLTTVEATYPRAIHSELMTHRDRARNSASSRAIPWPKMMERIQFDPFIPIRWGSEQKGMQTGGEIEKIGTAESIWLKARDNAVRSAQNLAALGVHKSLCNRLTEPFMWITVIMTATEWKNFFRLRCHPDAEIHFQEIAGIIRSAMEASQPRTLNAGDWHLPYVSNVDEDELRQTIRSDGSDVDLMARCLVGMTPMNTALCQISTGRCARVSYLTHQGKRDWRLDLDLFDKLANGSGFGHWSPTEHVAQAMESLSRSGPFVGWEQFRKRFPLENSEG